MFFNDQGRASLASVSGNTYQAIQSNISSIAIDSSNTLWAMQYSPTALEKFDGQTWTSYKSPDTNWTGGDDITADNQDRIWMIGNSNITMFDGKNWFTFDSTNSALPNGNFMKITLDDAGNIWTLIGEQYQAEYVLAEYDGTSWKTFDVPYLQTDGIPSALGTDATGAVYIGTNPEEIADTYVHIEYGGTLLQFKNNQWSRISISNVGALSSFSPVYRFGFDSHGNVWLGSILDGVMSFDGEKWQEFNASNVPFYPSSQVNGISSGLNGEVWFVGMSWNVYSSTGGGHFRGGAVCFDGSSWKEYDATNSGIGSDDITAVTVDNQGNKWFVSSGALIKFDGTTWKKIDSTNSGIASSAVTKCAVDRSGVLWFATATGASKFDGSTWTNYTSTNSGIPGGETDIGIAPDGKVWFWAGYDKGSITSFDGSTWTTYGCPGPDHCFAVDSSGHVWVGTYGNGVARFALNPQYSGSNWTSFNQGNSPIGYDYIEGIMCDKNGNIWFGAQDYGGGVSVYNPNGVTKVNPVEQLPSNFRLYQNYPNPFNPSTTISYQLPSNSFVSMELYDVLGRPIKTLENEHQSAGEHLVTFDASGLASGVYFYRLQAGAYHDTKKLLLLK